MADQGLIGAEKGVAQGSTGGLFGALLGGAAGYALGATAPKTVTPWYETEKGIAAIAGGVVLIILFALAYRKVHK